MDSGTYYCATKCTNSPDNTDYIWVLVLKSSGVDVDASQIAWNLNNIWVRRKSGTWGSWLKYNAVADFYKNYSTLENLAKAVNGLITLDVPQSLDADDILYTGVYQTNLLSNIPVAGGHLLICIRGNTDYVAQILIKVSGSPDVYIRSRVDRSGWSWTGWNRLSMSVV